MHKKITFNLLCSFLFILCFHSFAFAGTLRFAQVTDIHYSHDATTNSSRNVSDSAKNLYFAVMSLNKKKPDFVVFLGDQIDKSEVTDIKYFMQYVDKLEMPYYLTFGNHDAYKMTGIPKEVYLYAVAKTSPYQNQKDKYYTFKPNKNILCVVLDGSSKFAPSAHGEYDEQQLQWLEKQIKKNKKKLVLIFQHFPLIPPYEHKSHEVLSPEAYWELLAKYPNILLISSGHYHEAKVNVDKTGIRHISTMSLLNKPASYNMVTVDYDKNSYKSAKDVKITVEQVRI